MATAVPAGSPLDGGAAHVPSPCQNVPTAAPVPLFRFATAKFPVIFVALPLKLAVIVPAEKSPEPSLTTALLAVLADVNVAAVSYTHQTLPTKA